MVRVAPAPRSPESFVLEILHKDIFFPSVYKYLAIVTTKQGDKTVVNSSSVKAKHFSFVSSLSISLFEYI